MKKLLLSLILALTTTALAQFNYTVNADGTATITGYAWGYVYGELVIPDSIDGHTVEIIGWAAFANQPAMSSVIVPESVAIIEPYAFAGGGPYGNVLDHVVLPRTLKRLGHHAFYSCMYLNQIIMPDSLPTIETETFKMCADLPTITLPQDLTSIEDAAFAYCLALSQIYFLGNPPAIGSYTFFALPTGSLGFYLPTATGWGSDIGGLPVYLWNPVTSNPQVYYFGINAFEFIITGDPHITVTVEATDDLLSGAWTPISTNSLALGYSFLVDYDYPNFDQRFYRLRSPFGYPDKTDEQLLARRQSAAVIPQIAPHQIFGNQIPKIIRPPFDF
jgi:hypothetical protein